MISQPSRRTDGSAYTQPRRKKHADSSTSPFAQTDSQAARRRNLQAAKGRARQQVQNLPKRAFAAASPTRDAWANLLRNLLELPKEREFSAICWFSGIRHRLTVGAGSITMACDIDSKTALSRGRRRVEGLNNVLAVMAEETRWTKGFFLLGGYGFSKKELRELGGMSARRSLLG